MANGTIQPTQEPGCTLPNGYVSIIDGVLLMLIQQFALWGNLLVFLAFFRYRVLRTVMNMFIASLSAADILVSILPLPLTFAVFVCTWLPTQYVNGKLTEHIYIICDVTSGAVSIMSLTLVAVERCIAVAFPFRHNRIITKKVSIACTAFIWVCAFTAAMMKLVMDRAVFTLFTFLVSFAIPVPIMFISYTMIACIARNQARKIFALERATRLGSIDVCKETQVSSDSHGDSQPSSVTPTPSDQGLGHLEEPSRKKSQSSVIHLHDRLRRGTIKMASRARSLKRELKAAKTLSLIMLSFLVTWTPFMAVNIQFYQCVEVNRRYCDGFLITYEFVKYSKILHYFNSALNPFLYALLNRKWRAAFKGILCACRRRNNQAEPIQSELAGW